MTRFEDLTRDPRVRALFDVIARGETSRQIHLAPQSYSVLVGGTQLLNLNAHPNRLVRLSRRLASTAAGRYQFLYRTWLAAWTSLRDQGLALPDFGPRSQDIAAVWLLNQRNALNPLFLDQWDTLMDRISHEWASLPDRNERSRYGQGCPYTRAQLRAYYRERLAVHSADSNPASTPRPLAVLADLSADTPAALTARFDVSPTVSVIALVALALGVLSLLVAPSLNFFG